MNTLQQALKVAQVVMILLLMSDAQEQIRKRIHFTDHLEKAGIDFVHYAPRPRWCEVGPTVQGAATNEGLERVFREQMELWKSGNRLLTLEEFAHVHLVFDSLW